ncbi:UNVERIFIED_CONTAM: anti-repressor SinI family protein [Halobacillus marinus]
MNTKPDMHVLDEEWMSLMREAKAQGLSVEDVKNYLQQEHIRSRKTI